MVQAKISAFAMITGALALLMLLRSSGHLWQVAIFAILLGASETANPLAWAIMGDFFGRTSSTLPCVDGSTCQTSSCPCGAQCGYLRPLR